MSKQTKPSPRARLQFERDYAQQSVDDAREAVARRLDRMAEEAERLANRVREGSDVGELTSTTPTLSNLTSGLESALTQAAQAEAQLQAYDRALKLLDAE